MRITQVDTIQTPCYPRHIWVQLHTDEGLVGLGETSQAPGAVAAYIHDVVAPALLGKDPLAIEQHHHRLTSVAPHRNRSVEIRAASAIDIALWDLYGKVVGMPVYRCLGGPVRDAIRVYNTCAGYAYNIARDADGRPASPFASSWEHGALGPYEDQLLWQDSDRAGDLARSLLESGITAMKIWPFDRFSDGSGGQHITPAQIRQGVRPFERIREAVGAKIEIALELHSRWNFESALRIAKAVEEFEPLWYEDPVRMSNPDVLAEFASRTSVPVLASETLSTRFAFRELLEKNAIGIAMFDPGWVGGITESRRVSILADTYHRVVTPHDCSGPLVYVTGVHLCLATPNAFIQESVRAFYHGWFADVLTDLPRVEKGYARPPSGPGLGTSLRSDFLTRADVSVRTTVLE